ncbi:unnamed protein product, partial [Ixodes pacificus]
MLGWPVDSHMVGSNPSRGARHLVEAYCRKGGIFGCTSKDPQVIKINLQSSAMACQMSFVDLARTLFKFDLGHASVCRIFEHPRAPHFFISHVDCNMSSRHLDLLMCRYTSGCPTSCFWFDSEYAENVH